MPDTTYRAADLAKRSEKAFSIEPDAEARKALAEALDISAIKKLRFAGTLSPVGKQDWRLEAELGATVVQPCVVTLAPVTTRIDTTVARRFMANWSEPEAGSEVEIPEDDTMEPLGAAIDLGAVMAEELALALPDYPRAEGAELGEAIFTEPSAEPMTDEAAKPFAGLAKLKKDLEG